MNTLLKKIACVGVSIVLVGFFLPAQAREQQTQGNVREEKKEFNEDLFLKVEKLIGQGAITEAEKVLKDFVAGIPHGWQPIHTLPDRITIVCWNKEEFLAYARYNQKLRQFKKIVWLDEPSYSQALYLLGFLAVEKKNFEQALAYFDKALLLEPDHPTLLCEKAFAISQMGRNEEAYALYMKAFDIRPWALAHQRAVALRGAGFALTELKRLNEATALYKKSLELEPDNDIALHELEYLKYLQSGGSIQGAKTVVTGADTKSK